MIFLHPSFLYLLLLPAAFLLWQFRTARANRRGALLKSFAAAFVILALAEPQLETNQQKVASVVLVDTSASISEDGLRKASDFVSDLDRQKGGQWMRVIPFARGTRSLTPQENASGWRLTRSSGESAKGTDLEAAIRHAIAAIPSGFVGRVVLLSDGNENEGSVTRAADIARQFRIPVDTFALSGNPKPLLRVETVSLPPFAFTGERFAIDLVIESPKAVSGNVELSAESRVIGASPVQLDEGSNQVRVYATLNVTGAVELTGKVTGGDLGQVRFEQAITLRRPRVLYVSNDPDGSEANLLGTLRAGQFEVRRAAEVPSRGLDDYQIVVLNNQDIEHLADSAKNNLEIFVKAGGGLLVIGGERNIYIQDKKVEHALDRVLPAKLAPPRSPEGTCVVLIIDKSSSMEGRKMELARIAAIGAIDNLRPVDTVGVLIFDNSFQWAVPLRRAEDRSTIKRLVSGITPDGGTQIAPALSEGFRRIVTSNATYRHVVLLTDGISEEGDSIALSKEASSKRVTISTVGLGQDVNRAYLEKVATFAKGRSYFLTDPSGLEQILIKDVMEHTGSSAIEKPLTVSVPKQSKLLEGIGMESAPALKGYVKYESKPGAEVLLNVEEKEPLYTHWQAGLGRAAVFASDAKSRWAEQWIAWKGFDRFWLNVFRDLLPQAQAGEMKLSYDSSTGNLVIDQRIAPVLAQTLPAPELFAFGPNGFQQPVSMRKLAEGAYRGEVPVGNRKGLFRVRPVEESRLFGESGLYRQEQEFNQFGSNEDLLRQVSNFTGGRFNPAPAQVFDPGNRSVPVTIELWPGLLAAAILLHLIELVMRKWRALLETIRTWRAAPVA